MVSEKLNMYTACALELHVVNVHMLKYFKSHYTVHPITSPVFSRPSHSSPVTSVIFLSCIFGVPVDERREDVLEYVALSFVKELSMSGTTYLWMLILVPSIHLNAA